MNELTKEGVLRLRFEIALGQKTSHENLSWAICPIVTMTMNLIKMSQ